MKFGTVFLQNEKNHYPLIHNHLCATDDLFLLFFYNIDLNIKYNVR